MSQGDPSPGFFFSLEAYRFWGVVGLLTEPDRNGTFAKDKMPLSGNEGIIAPAKKRRATRKWHNVLK